jgi:hypothetical protein
MVQTSVTHGGLPGCYAAWTCTDVSEEHNATVFGPEVGGSMLLRNVDTHPREHGVTIQNTIMDSFTAVRPQMSKCCKTAGTFNIYWLYIQAECSMPSTSSFAVPYNCHTLLTGNTVFIFYYSTCSKWLSPWAIHASKRWYSLSFPSSYALFHTFISGHKCTPLPCFAEVIRKQIGNFLFAN